MKIICNLSKIQHKCKPDDGRRVQYELITAAEHTLEEICDRLNNGYAIRPAGIIYVIDKEGKFDKYSFISQQVFIVDFDNKGKIYTPDEAIKTAAENGLKPCFIYYSYSSTKETPKFHTVFCFDKPVTNVMERDNIQKYLTEIFGGNADKLCNNTTRIFYGSYGKGTPPHKDFSAINSLSALETILGEYTPQIEQKASAQWLERKRQTIRANDAIKMIEAHDTTGMKKALGTAADHTTFSSKQSLYDYVCKELDLAEYMGLPGGSFPCLFHDDHKASATVFRNRNGVWLYNCFGCGAKNLNLLRVTEKLGRFGSQYQALQFVKSVYGLALEESASVIQAKEDLEAIRRLINGDEGDLEAFEDLAPMAYKISKKEVPLLCQIINFAIDHVTDEQIDTNGNYIFSVSDRKLKELCAGIRGCGSLDKLHKKICKLQYLLILRKPNEKAIPAAVLQKVKGQYKAHTSLYFVPSWTANHIERIEARATEFDRNGYTLSSMSGELLTRTEGEQTAAEIFTQTTYHKPTKASDEAHNHLVKIINKLISKNGYCTRQMIIDASTMSPAKINAQLGRSLADICNTYGLMKTMNCKAIQAKYGTPNHRNIYVIVPDDEREGNVTWFISERISNEGFCYLSDLYKQLPDVSHGQVKKLVYAVCKQGGSWELHQEDHGRKRYYVTIGNSKREQ